MAGFYTEILGNYYFTFKVKKGEEKIFLAKLLPDFTLNTVPEDMHNDNKYTNKILNNLQINFPY